MRAIGLTRERLGRDVWRASVRDQARQFSTSTAERSKPVGTLPKEAGWWIEKDPAERARLERIVAAIPPELPSCVTCGGAKWVRVGALRISGRGTSLAEGMPRNVRDIQRCPDCNKPSADELLVDARIPKQYRNATFETFALTPGKSGAALDMRSWADTGAPESILLLGAPGRGKTHLAIAAIKVLIENGVACRFVQASDLLDQLKASFDSGKNEAVEQRYRKARVLVLDDIGAARPTPYAVDRISALIEARLTGELPTVITCDKGADELIEMGYDGRVVSRLRLYKPIRIEGEDMRGVKR